MAVSSNGEGFGKKLSSRSLASCMTSGIMFSAPSPWSSRSSLSPRKVMPWRSALALSRSSRAFCDNFKNRHDECMLDRWMDRRVNGWMNE
eukprot:scaffold354144_cov19-Prasinocladus_malaysianus.AAC.1